MTNGRSNWRSGHIVSPPTFLYLLLQSLIMASSGKSFHYQEENVPFERTDGSKVARTAVLSISRSNGVRGEGLRYGLPDVQTLYETIKAGEPLNLDDCFVPEFSLENYRQWAGLDKNTPVPIHDFSGQGALFSAKAATVFAHASFEGNQCSFKDACFLMGHVDFSNCKFSTANIDFTRTNFEAGASFPFAQFGDGHVIFNEADFGAGKTSFVNANFGNGKVGFRSVTFGPGEADFHFSKFGVGDKLFDKVSFQGGLVDFRKVEFGHGKIDFRWTDFGNARVVFDEAEVEEGRITFNRCRMGASSFSWETGIGRKSDFTMEKADLGQSTLSFSGSEFHKLSLASCHFNNYTDLRVEKCAIIDLTDTLNRDLIDLKPVKTKVEVEQLVLIGMRNLGRIILDWNTNRLESLIHNQPKSTLWQKADQFRLLKEDFGQSGEYQFEDASYVAFKRMELKAELARSIENNQANAIWAYPRAWFKYIIMDKMGLYATDPMRVLLSMTVVYVLFSLLYVVIIPYSSADIVSSLGDPDQLSLFTKSFYHSAITFLTIGYGDYYPSGSIRWLSSIEGFVGLFLMSYFTVAFVRKILR